MRQDSHTGVLTLRASSPDEEALVKAAAALGYSFVAAAPNMQVNVKHKGDAAPHTEHYTMLAVNEFNSNRCACVCACVRYALQLTCLSRLSRPFLAVSLVCR